MTDANIQTKAIKALIAMNAAIRNLRLYPSSSSSSANSIDKTYEILKEILDEFDSLHFSETERSLSINNRPLPEKEQKKDQIVAFMDVILNFAVKTITFKKGTDRQGLTTFLELLSKKPETIDEMGGLADILANESVTGIEVTQAGADYGSGGPGYDFDVIAQEIFDALMTTLEKHLDQDEKTKIAQGFAKVLSDKENTILMMTLFRKPEGELAKNLFTYLIEEITDDKFEELIEWIKEKQSGEAVFKTTYQRMMATPKGKALQARIKAREEKEKAERQKQLARFKEQLNHILKGDFEPFKEPPFMTFMTDTVIQFYTKGKEKTGDAILDKVGSAMVSDDPQIRTPAAGLVSDILKALPEQDLKVTSALTPQLTEWIKIEPYLTPAYENIAQQLKALVQHFVSEGQLGASYPILNTFNLIYSGKLDRDEDLEQFIGNILFEAMDDEALSGLMTDFRTGDDAKRKAAVAEMVHIGAPAIRELLNILKDSDDRFERSRILQVIPDIGDASIPMLKDRIQEGGPWYFIRNLALLMGKVGNETHVEVLKPLLTYSAAKTRPEEIYKVKFEALNSIYVLASKFRDCEEIMIEALPEADDRLKADIAGMLGALESEAAIPQLMDIIQSGSASDLLLEKAATALGNIGSQEAIPALSALMSEKKKGLLGGSKGPSDKVKMAATKALEKLSRAGYKPKDPKPSIRKPVKKISAKELAERQKMEEELKDSEKQVDQYIKGNNGEAAMALITELIEKYVTVKNFIKAEELREKILQVDSMAITEYTKANELIDQAKTEALDPDYMEMWSQLFEPLTPDEKNTLFFSLREAFYEPEHVVFRQGEENAKLYFIFDGDLKLVYTQGDDELEIKTYHSGDIAGDDTFFYHSLCTATLKCTSNVKLHYIDQDMLSRWKEHTPALKSKLQNHCFKFQKIADAVKKNKIDRRKGQRIDMGGKVSAQLINNANEPVGNSILGDLSDFSSGGICFRSKIPKDVVGILLNRKMNVKYTIRAGKAQKQMDQNGKVVSVRYDFENTYAVHFNFDQPISEKSVEKIAASMK